MKNIICCENNFHFVFQYSLTVDIQLQTYYNIIAFRFQQHLFFYLCHIFGSGSFWRHKWHFTNTTETAIIKNFWCLTPTLPIRSISIKELRFCRDRRRGRSVGVVFSVSRFFCRCQSQDFNGSFGREIVPCFASRNRTAFRFLYYTALSAENQFKRCCGHK